MNSTNQTSQNTVVPRVAPKWASPSRDKSIQFLQGRIEEIKRKIQDSPGLADQYKIRIEIHEKQLAELLAQPEPEPDTNEKNGDGSDPDVASEQVGAGQEADTSRTEAGQKPDTDRSSSGQCPPSHPPLGPIEQLIAEQINQKSQSPLDQLPLDLQEKLFQLVTEFPIASVTRTLSLPPPTGWGISTSRQALYRFRDRYAELKLREHRKELKRLANNIIEDTQGADDQFTDASERLLKLRLLETANDPTSKTRDLRDLFQTLIRLRAARPKTESHETQ